MYINKLHLSEKLIAGFVKIPPSLKEQTLTKLAIKLCQYTELKQNIIVASEELYIKGFVSSTGWERIIEGLSEKICGKLDLSPDLRKTLIIRIRSIALELFSWNKHHQVLFKLSPEFTEHLLISTDWTVEGRLNEKKIAERLVGDERIPVHGRYKLACLNFLEHSIPLLWDQISAEDRKAFYSAEESDLIVWWSIICFDKNEINVHNESNLSVTFLSAVREGAKVAVISIWELLLENERQQFIITAAMEALEMYFKNNDISWMELLMKNRKWLASPENYTELLYFLFSEMSQDQRAVFLQKAISAYDKVLRCFLQPHYQELFIPIVTKMWGILPEETFAEQVCDLVIVYVDPDVCEFKIIKDYDYGGSVMELLEQAPANYKRYIFSSRDSFNGFIRIKENIGEAILFEIIRKNPLEKRNINIFQRILQQATFKERETIMRYGHGEEFCQCLALSENWDLLDWTIEQCLPKKDIVKFKKKFMASYYGIHTCRQMLLKESEDPANHLFQWSSLSEQEISKLKTKILSTNYQDEIVSLLENPFQGITVDCLDRLLDRCLSVCDKEQFKKQFTEKNALRLCEFFVEYSFWDKATYFLNWCFPSEKAIEQFKQRLFHDKVLPIVINFVLQNEWLNVEHITQWFKLCPGKIKKMKKDVLFLVKTQEQLFSLLCSKRKEEVVLILQWSLDDKETLMAFKQIFEENHDFEALECGTEAKQLWDELITDLLCDLHNR